VLDVAEVSRLAEGRGLREVQYNEISKVIAFDNGDKDVLGENHVRWNVYYSTGKCGTYLTHPIRKNSPLFRPREGTLTYEELDEIFRRPRTHTIKGGYHHKEELKKTSATFAAMHLTEGADGGDTGLDFDDSQSVISQVSNMTGMMSTFTAATKDN